MMSLVAVEASVILKEEKICYKMVYFIWKRRKFATKWYISFCVRVKPFARNRGAKVEFTQPKNFSKKGLALLKG